MHERALNIYKTREKFLPIRKISNNHRNSVKAILQQTGSSLIPRHITVLLALSTLQDDAAYHLRSRTPSNEPFSSVLILKICPMYSNKTNENMTPKSASNH